MSAVCAIEDELRLEAEAEWWLAAMEALQLGMYIEVEFLRPKPDADWREIERCSWLLRMMIGGVR